MTVEVAPYRGTDVEWDRFVASVPNGTVFHRRAFLGYHGERWREADRSVVFLKGAQLVGVLPLGADPSGREVASPWGASFGAPLLTIGTVAEVNAAVHALVDHARKEGWRSLRMGLPPAEYGVTDATFEFALSRAGFRPVGIELSQMATIPRDQPVESLLSSKARNKSRNAVAAFEIDADAGLASFFDILTIDRARLGVAATHRIDELADLDRRCPGTISYEVATHREHGGRAGACYFRIRPGLDFAFYLCQEDTARGSNGVNALVLDRMRRLQEAGGGRLDFGTSSLAGVLNEGLAAFKESMGGRVILRRTYLLELGEKSDGTS